jgi:hypothetical protein
MHDPLVVAFEIRRPWPKRQTYCPPSDGRFAWMPPFFTVFGRRYWFPPVVTIWHREPGGHDSGEICKHYRRTRQPDGTWRTKILHGWRFHLNHWRVQIGPLQALRRRLLTRCAWCGGREHRHDAINISHSWDGPRGRWWRGEPGVYHHDCSLIANAHHWCVCENPVLEHDTYGRCARCDRSRRFGATAGQVERMRLAATVPAGARDRQVYDRVCAMAEADR